LVGWEDRLRKELSRVARGHQTQSIGLRYDNSNVTLANDALHWMQLHRMRSLVS